MGGFMLVLVHGFWHGSWCWSEVVPHLVAAGRRAVAVDMAGHGLYARHPRWFTRQPYDAEAVVSEVSPVADVTLDDAAELLLSQIKLIGGGEPVTVAAHSAAGPVLTRVAEPRPGGARGLRHRVHAGVRCARRRVHADSRGRGRSGGAAGEGRSGAAGCAAARLRHRR